MKKIHFSFGLLGLCLGSLTLAGCPGNSPTRPFIPRPTNTLTPTSTVTNTPTATSSGTPTMTATNSPTATITDTPTVTATETPTDTVTNTPTVTFTPTITFTPTNTATFTPCPNQVGKLTVGSSSGSIYQTVFWLKVPITTAVSVSHLHARVTNPAGDGADMGIYSDNSGQPGNLLVHSNFQSLVAGINDFSITSTPLSAGTTYWLAISTGASGTISYDTGGSGWDATGTFLPLTQSGGTSTSAALDLFADNCPQ